MEPCRQSTLSGPAAGKRMGPGSGVIARPRVANTNAKGFLTAAKVDGLDTQASETAGRPNNGRGIFRMVAVVIGLKG